MTNVNMEKCESETEKNLTPCDCLVQQRELTSVFVLHARETRSHAGFRLTIKAGANYLSRQNSVNSCDTTGTAIG